MGSVRRGINEFKKRQEQVAEQMQRAAKERADKRRKLWDQRSLERAKRKREIDKFNQAVAAEVLLKVKSDEIISRRRQGQSSRQIAGMTGVGLTKVRVFLRKSGLSPID